MQEKKKILFVITKGNFGGAQRYVYDLATNLSKEKFEAVVACGEGEVLPNLLNEKNIRVVRINKLVREVGFFDEFKVCKELIDLVRLEKPDVIHLNSSKAGGIGAVAGMVATWFEKNYSPKVIFTAHNWGFNDTNRSLLEKAFYFVSHWVTIMLCHKVVAVSAKTKRDVGCMPFVKEKIEIIYNGISNFDSKPKKESRKAIAGIDSEKTIIFSVSELHKNKGVDVALRAVSLLPSEIREKITYCIAGDGEEKKNLEKLTDELGISDSIKFLGYVPDAKNLFSGADVFLLPSRTEAFPYAVLEAGLTGVPTIATSVGGVPEIIRDMQNGILVHSENSKEIAEAIMYLLDRPEKKKEFSEEIKKTVSTFFSLEKMLEETVRLYQ